LVAIGGQTTKLSAFSRSVGIFPQIAAKLLIGSKKLGGAKTGRASSITKPNVVGIVGRAPAVDEKV